ncbi:MAG TPA: dihydrolipoyl dehydrogenase [Acidobacteriota bacterium]
MPERVKLAVIGGGPGGYAAAFHAADLGLEVALVDAAPRPGGVCLHRGCIPSKTLLHVARLIQETRAAKRWGVRFGEPEVDLDALRRFKDEVVLKLAGGVAELGKRRGVRLIEARAVFADSETLELEGEGVPRRLGFDHAIVATGSVPAIPASLRVDDPRVMDSTEALQLPEIPNRLLVVGGGYIGLELGSVYAALGSKVTVVELTGGLLPGVDRDLVRPLQARLEELLQAIDLSTEVRRLEPREEGIRVHLQGQGVDAEQLFDRVLVSVGRRPNSAELGLDKTQVELDARGFLKVDRRCRTRDPHILAIGDVAREPMLAHKATREGKVAAEVVAGKPAEFDSVAIPAVVFTDPEIAWCGLTETEAKARGRAVRVARFPWGASGRAQTLGRAEGLTKHLFDPESGRILGVGLVGAGAGELIAEGVLAVEMGAVARDLADTIHAHPTLSETLGEAAEAFFGEATHIFSRKS